MCKKLHTSKEGWLTDASQAHLDEQMSFYHLPHYTKALKLPLHWINQTKKQWSPSHFYIYSSLKTAVKLLQKTVFIVPYKNSF